MVSNELSLKMPENDFMECRSGCGACCIALSISSPIPGMEGGKAVGERCIHLMDDYKCALFGKPERPPVCSAFKAEPLFCGTNRDEAMKILLSLSDSSTND
jgi:hypothetical protein